jgi:fumarate reductase (CoM/CoB) subunit B
MDILGAWAQRINMAYEGILTNCDDCGVCVEECLFLRKYSLTPLQAALEGATPAPADHPATRKSAIDLAFSCLLCGLCDSVCPSQLSPAGMFADLRALAVKRGTVVPNCRPYFTDRKYNLYSIYRSANSIDYSDLGRKQAKTVLFPGCSLGTFFPKLTRALFDNLAASEPDLGIMIDCCQKPLKDLGFGERYANATERLESALDEMGVEKIIAACPSCLQVLAERFKDRQVVSCYPLLRPVNGTGFLPSLESEGNGGEERSMQSARITVHDSCSDRETGTVGSQVRDLLSRTKGAEIVEMVHNRRNSLCCGSGGLVPAFDPGLASEFTSQRIGEAESSGAEMMITYCATCANAFHSGGRPSSVEIRHALELLLGVKEDYDAVRTNLDRLFVSGPKKELYKRLIEDSP